MKNTFAVTILLIFMISLFAQSDWSEPQQLSRDGTYPILNFGVPAITVDNNGVIYALWVISPEEDGGDYPWEWYSQIEYRRSTDGGLTWSVTENITPEYLTERIYYMKATCDSENNIHLVYMRGYEGLKVMYKKFDGVSWTESVQIGYGSKSVYLKCDDDDRLFCTWYVGNTSYYSYCDLNDTVPVWIESQYVHLSEDSRVNDFCFDEKGNVHAIGTYTLNTFLNYRPYYHFFDKQLNQWTIHEEIGDFGVKSLGNAIALSKNNTLYTNVAVGQSLDNNTDNHLTKYMYDSNWSEPYEYGENNNWDREMYIDKHDYLHLFELHFYEGDVGGDVGIIHSTGKNGVWETAVIDSSNEDFSYSSPSVAFDRINKKFFLVYYKFDKINKIGRIYFHSKQNTTDIEDNFELLVDDYVLKQNYPNPFNNQTEISYTIGRQSHVELSIFNPKGEIVSVLVNSKQNKGKYSVTFNAEELNSGIYYYQLKINGVLSSVKRMILLK